VAHLTRMMHYNSFTPDAAAGQKSAANEATVEITDKRGFGQRWLFAPRTIDNFLRQGMPHCKIGKRRVRIVVADGDAWMRERFGVQHRLPAK
jgi:hypothetical protein